MEVLKGLAENKPFATLLSLFAGMFWLGRTLATRNDVKDLKNELIDTSSNDHEVIEKHIDRLHDDIREMRNMMRGT